jgi:hypothetical protein
VIVGNLDRDNPLHYRDSSTSSSVTSGRSFLTRIRAFAVEQFPIAKHNDHSAIIEGPVASVGMPPRWGDAV